MPIPYIISPNQAIFDVLLNGRTCNFNLNSKTFSSFVKYNWWASTDFDEGLQKGNYTPISNVLTNSELAPYVPQGSHSRPLYNYSYTIGQKLDSFVAFNVSDGSYDISSTHSGEENWVSIFPLVFIVSQPSTDHTYNLSSFTSSLNSFYLGFLLQPCKLSSDYKGYGNFALNLNMSSATFPYETTSGSFDIVRYESWHSYDFDLSYDSVSDKPYLISSVEINSLSFFSTGSDGFGDTPTYRIHFSNSEDDPLPIFGTSITFASNSGSPYVEGFQEGVNQSLTGESGAWDLFESAFTTAGHVFSVELFPNFTLGTLLLIPLMATIVVWILHLIKK